MGLETGSFISALVATNPVGASDPKSQGDDHLRFIKAKILETFPNVTGAVTATHAELNLTVGAAQGLATLSASLAAAITKIGEIGSFSTSLSTSDITGTIRSPLIRTITPDKLAGGTLGAVGYLATAYNAGTKSTGTYTPAYANGNIQYAVNGGAHTLAPQAGAGTIIVQYTNNASAGAITTSGWTKVTGAFTTTNGDDFMCYLTVVGSFSHLTIVALQ